MSDEQPPKTPIEWLQAVLVILFLAFASPVFVIAAKGWLAIWSDLLSGKL